MCDKPFKISSVFKVALQTVFYSVIAILILYCFGGSIGIRTAITEMLSPVYGCYWFVTAYIGMCLLSPLLNIALQRINSCSKIGGHTPIPGCGAAS